MRTGRPRALAGAVRQQVHSIRTSTRPSWRSRDNITPLRFSSRFVSLMCIWSLGSGPSAYVEFPLSTNGFNRKRFQPMILSTWHKCSLPRLGSLRCLLHVCRRSCPQGPHPHHAQLPHAARCQCTPAPLPAMPPPALAPHTQASEGTAEGAHAAEQPRPFPALPPAFVARALSAIARAARSEQANNGAAGAASRTGPCCRCARTAASS